MVVRFLPVPDQDAQANADPAPEREGLAEVVELRSRLLGAVAKSSAVAKSGADGWAGDSDDDDPSPRQARRRQGSARKPPELGSARALELAEAQIKRLPAGRKSTAADEGRDVYEASSGPSRTATEDGVRILARRARSEGEVRRALVDLGHEAADIDDVLAEFTRSGYLDDADLARALTTSLRERSQSSRAQIRRKLMERKLPDAEIESALSELDEDEELVLLREAAGQRAGRMRDLDRVTAERRLLGFLARRGWSGESARSAASAALDGVGIRR